MRFRYKYTLGKAFLFLFFGIGLLLGGIMRAFQTLPDIGFSDYVKHPVVLNGAILIPLSIGFLLASILNFIRYNKPIPPNKWKKRKNWLKHS